MGAVESAKKKITKKQSKQYIKKIQAYYEPIVLGDEKVDFIDANPAAISLFKAKSKKQICSKGPNGLSADFQSAFNLPTSKAAPLAIQSAFNSPEGFFDFDWLYRDLDGKDFWVHVWATPINMGGKLVIQGLIRLIPGRGMVTTLDLGFDAAYFVKPFSDKIKSTLDTETESQIEQTKSSPQTDSETNIKKEEKPTHEVRKSIIVFPNDDLEMEFDEKIDYIKSLIRSHENPKLEKKIVDALNQAKSLFTRSNLLLQEQIEQLTQRIQTQKKKNSEKYFDLEEHLQNSLKSNKELTKKCEVLTSNFQIIKKIFNDPELEKIVDSKEK
ncbi:vacuolar protein sorting-associated protein 37a [Anaeramoeba ignava]|uniref:Vacuolar protein sorting-associated protein 37a n=1 Tax=Anaeramoeba ignava TaxID=1746090 RepID=A0A9Q0L5Y8_ANAIG|nr:vacuolar protein sorting-associated protein 37a [Anaeramoeba ignava]